MPKNQLRSFLSVHHQSGRPLVAAVSGGSDSLTLLFTLQELGVPVHVAHLDHGWREESEGEARALEKLVREATDFPFHCRRVEPSKSNLEAHGRAQRLAFFKEVCEEVGAEAVLLAHHADDQAETVFKRVTEGAALHKLGGMAPVSQVDGVTLWRPFLTLPRSALATEPLVDDPSNRDPRFQRVRIRHQLLPQLGRGAVDNLVRLGEDAQLLGDYLDERLAPVLESVCEGPLGRWLEVPSLHRVELRHLVRHFRPGMSREAVDRVCQLLGARTANKRVEDLQIDRGRLFLPTAATFEVGEGSGPAGWQALWAGAASIAVPPGSLVGDPDPQASVPGHKNLSHWYNVHSVPAFLRQEVPVVYSEGRVVAEFLTGRSLVASGATISLTCSPCGYKKSNGGRILSLRTRVLPSPQKGLGYRDCG